MTIFLADRKVSEEDKIHEKQTKFPKKRQIAWDWSRGCASDKQTSVSLVKKIKVAKGERASEKFFCLECLELSLQGKGEREERFTTICRTDPSSVKRHKDRWHKLPSLQNCTIVPSTAREVRALKHKYKQEAQTSITSKTIKPSESTSTSSVLEQGDVTPNTESSLLAIELPLHADDILETSKDEDEERPTLMMTTVNKNQESPPKTCQSHAKDLDQESVRSETDSNTLQGDSAKKQTTLLCYAQPDQTNDSGKATSVTSLDNIMDAIASLSLKVEILESSTSP